MKTVFHKADTRGGADHGWLKAHHSFSFADYYNPDRVQFGALRVLNDDWVAPHSGFGRHPHHDMEIITVPLSGELTHEDNTGHKGVIRAGDVQVMSAGAGIVHSEMNESLDTPVSLLQIWIFPERKSVRPRYDQKTFDASDFANNWRRIVGPDEAEGGLMIHQQAWLHVGRFDASSPNEYKLHTPNHGLYVFVIEGKAEVAGQALSQRDAIGLWDTATVNIEPQAGAFVLLLEVPMLA